MTKFEYFLEELPKFSSIINQYIDDPNELTEMALHSDCKLDIVIKDLLEEVESEPFVKKSSRGLAVLQRYLTIAQLS